MKTSMRFIKLSLIAVISLLAASVAAQDESPGVPRVSFIQKGVAAIDPQAQILAPPCQFLSHDYFIVVDVLIQHVA